VTITHPHHPLRGQQLPIVGIRHGASPDVIVRLPDGSHGAIQSPVKDRLVGTTSGTGDCVSHYTNAGIV